MPVWAWGVPVLAALALAAGLWLPPVPEWLGLSGLALMAAVMTAVHHAEVIAHKLGEPLGTLVLALAVTIIEVAMIVTLMRAGGDGAAFIARDTVYSAIMIICTGVMGLCLTIGGIMHREQTFRVEGANVGFGALLALAGLSLVLPTFTTSTPSGTYSVAQLAFAGAASLALWLLFIFVQTVRHRGYFLASGEDGHADAHADAGPTGPGDSPPPSAALAWASLALLVLSLATVIGLAKQLSVPIEALVTRLGAPKAVIGVVIALLVLLPETWAAARAAYLNRLQTSLNLAVGSALASIGLTIPVVAAVSVGLDLPLHLGIEGKDLVLLMLTFAVGTLTMAHGRTTVMQGGVHLVLFAAFLFMTLVP